MVEQIEVIRWVEELRVDIVPPQEDLLALLSIIIAIRDPSAPIPIWHSCAAPAASSIQYRDLLERSFYTE